MKRINYKVDTLLELRKYTMNLVARVLDTDAGKYFLRNSILALSMEKKIKQLDNAPKIRDAKKRFVKFDGIIDLQIILVRRTETVRFTARLGTSCISGCDSLHRYFEDINPRKRCVEISDGYTVTMMRSRRMIQPSHFTEEEASSVY